MIAEDTGAITRRFVRAAEAAYERKTVENKTEISTSLIGRIICWALFGGLTLTAAILSFQIWFGGHKVPVGVISWLSYLGTLSYVGAMTIQIAVNQRRILSAVERVDPIGIGQLAAQMQAGEVDRSRVICRLDRIEGALAELKPMLRDAYAAGFRDAYLSVKAELAGAEAQSSEDVGDVSDENVVRLPTPETVKVLEKFARKIVYPQRPPEH